MIITERENDSCRFWGYEPASRINLHTGTQDERKALRVIVTGHSATIKAAGHKANRLGFKNKGLAVAAAKKVETATGIEMHVFKHDYL